MDPEKILWESKKKKHVGFYGEYTHRIHSETKGTSVLPVSLPRRSHVKAFLASLHYRPCLQKEKWNVVQFIFSLSKICSECLFFSARIVQASWVCS